MPGRSWVSSQSHTAGLAFRDREEHGAQIGNEPDRPDEDAEPMEAGYPDLVLAHQDHRRPDRVHQHEDDRELPVTPWMSKVIPPTKTNMIPVPTVSHTRPSRKKARCQGLSLPAIRSLHTPTE